MKYSVIPKFLCLLSFFYIGALSAQNKFKLPENTVLYLEMNGNQLNNKVNWAKFNPIFQEIFQKEDKKTIWTDYSKTGIKYDETQFHYAVANDSISSYNAHFIVDDQTRFLNFINSAKKEGLEITKKTKYSYVSLNENTFIAWNDKHAVLKTIYYTKPFSYDDSLLDTDSTMVEDSATIEKTWPEGEDDDAVEEAISMDKAFDYKEEIIFLEEELVYYKQQISDSQTEIENIKKSIAYLKKNHKYPPSKPDDVQDADVQDDVQDDMEDGEEDKTYFEEDGSDEDYTKRRDSIKVEEFKIVRKLSELFFDEVFASNFIIEVPTTKTKFKDVKSDLFVHTNFAHFYKSRTGIKGFPAFGLWQNYLGKMYDADSSYNLYFEKDKVRLVTDYQHQDPAVQKAIAEIYKNKPNRKLAKLLSDKSIGYFAMNINGYKSFDAMYDLMENTGENQEYQNEISLVVETLKIALDEKAISKIMPGNAIFILNDLKSKKVAYTKYEYDEDYNEKEVQKTKDVTVPNFTFAFITKNESYWNRFFEMISTNKKTAKKFTKKGAFYELKDQENSAVDRLLFSVKNGIVYITTSPENIIANPPSSTTKKWAKSASKHSLSGWLNVQKLMPGLESEFTTKENKAMYDYMRKNMGEITYKTDVKAERLQSEMTYNIRGSSENSLMYFLDLFDEIYKIMKPIEKSKKL